MKTDQIITFGHCLLAALTLGITSSIRAQDTFATPTPPVAPAPPAALAPAPPADLDEPMPEPPRGKRKQVRVERRGPGNRVQVEEQDEFKESVRDFDAGRGVAVERHVELVSPDGKKRIIHIDGGDNGDVMIRKFRGNGPMIAAGVKAGGREEHLERAIEHLHAAGMHDLAEKAEARAEKLRLESKEDGQLRQQFEELKRENDRLKRQLKKMKKDEKPEVKQDEGPELQKN